MLEKACVLFLVGLCVLLASKELNADVNDIRWLSDGPQGLVAGAHGYSDVKIKGDCWEGIVSDPADPNIVLRPVDIDADAEKFLYLKMVTGRAARIQVYFSPHTVFSEALSFRWYDISDRDEPAVYAFDLSDYEPWNGSIRSLRIDLDGSDASNAVRLCAVGVSEGKAEGVVGLPITKAETVQYERMAAWHITMVATDESRPNSCVSTYFDDRSTYDHSPIVAKLVTGIELDGKEHWPVSARNVVVEDIPGGVVGEYVLEGVKVSTEIVPLMIGRDTPDWDGAALYSVKTDPPAPVIIRCGSGEVSSQINPRMGILRRDIVGYQGDTAEIEGSIGLIRGSQHAYKAAVRSSGELEVAKGEHGGDYLLARFSNGSGYLVIGHAKNDSRAREIVTLDAVAARREVSNYYETLLQSRIETPERVIDGAFRSALYNLEYNWIEPYGWNECIHHWLALWHMQHTAAAEWIGQADRSRACNIVTAQNLLGDGSVPQFMPSGITRKDFGGSNQFFAWQVRHYWNFTADREAIEIIAPRLDTVIAQTYAEYDPDNDGLLAWNQQIGNQEDYISTPFNGTSPTIEGINMLRTGAMLWRALGDSKKAEIYEARAEEAHSRLRSELWLRDLGRFAFYQDPRGVVRLDGQYHTFIYPVIWNILDPLDSWTSIRHLRDRLIGEGGETYCSNNFPNHVVATVGTQAGAAQQPWAAWGLAAAGLRNETYRPLKAVAEWVMNDQHRGAWPEVSTEPAPAYFSPPAGLFVQSTIEALFGLEVNRPEGYLKVSPSFPDHWPSAKLNLPEYSAEYKRSGNTVDYTVQSEDPIARRLRWMLPPSRINKVLVNDREVEFEVAPGVNCIILSVDTPPARNTRFTIDYSPVNYDISFPASIAQGEAFTLNIEGCTIERVEDPCGVLSSIQVIDGSRLQATVQNGFLEPYMRFGRLGQLNFSRRSFFLLCSAEGGTSFRVSVDKTILPRYEVCALGEVSDSGEIRFVVRNNTGSEMVGTAYLRVARQRIPIAVDVPARSEREYAAVLPKNLFGLLSPGDNAVSILLPGHTDIFFTVTASEVFRRIPKLREYGAARVVNIPLPDESLRPDTDWYRARNYYQYGHLPWAGSVPPMQSLEGNSRITLPELPSVEFTLEERKLAYVSWDLGTPSITVDLGSKKYKKLYLLVVPFLDNHDTFATIAQIDLMGKDEALRSRILTIPGDLDIWSPQELVGDFATARTPRQDRSGLLPILDSESNDWEQGVPPTFPQSELWANCITLRTPSAVMNVIEIDLAIPMHLRSVSISLLSANSALGLVAVSGEQPGGDELLDGTDWQISAQYREPRIIFDIGSAADLEGWRLEGDAFSVAPFPALFTVPTLNSLAKAGETATGKAVSPDFTIGPEDTVLELQIQGGNSQAEEGPGTLAIRLIDSGTGELLHNLQVIGSHPLRDDRIEVVAWRGSTVHLDLVDEKSGNSYAWLGLRSVRMSVWQMN